MSYRDIVKKIVPAQIRLLRYPLYYYSIMLRNFFFAEKEVKDYKEIPIIINNFNRYTMLRDLVECFEKRGYKNIYIIDNNSSYPPLLEYYKTIPYHVYRLKENLGFMTFKRSGIYKQFKNKFFVYTDPDIYLPDECPDDFIKHFYDILVSTPYCAKVGNALRIDDIPDCYASKAKVVEWESRYWQRPIGDDKYIAVIDTTLALYKPNVRVGTGYSGNRIRVAGKYTAIHRPWYIDSSNPDEEEIYYINSASQSTFWTKLNKDEK